MNFGRVIFNRAAKLCSKSSARITCNNKFRDVNVANFCRGITATKAIAAGFVNRKEYYIEDDLKSLNQIELEKFNHTFALIVENLTNEDDVQDERIKDVFARFKEILENTVFIGRKIHGKAMVSTYKLLAKSEDLTEENIQLANILGWCVEMLIASFLILDDIMDQSVIRYGMPCWFRNEHVGLMAINDATMIESGMFYILKKHFKTLPCYVHLMEIFNQVIRFSSFGQNLDMMCEYSRQSSKFECFTEDMYKAICKYKTAYFSFVLPIKLASYLAGWTNDTLKNADWLFLKLGECYQVQNDYQDCYGDPTITGKRSMDIEDGKCTWLIVTALKMASDEQIAILTENYGVRDEKSVRKVKEVFNEVELPRLYDRYKEETFRELTMLIDEVTNSTNLPPEIFHSFMEMLYERKNINERN